MQLIVSDSVVSFPSWTDCVCSQAASCIPFLFARNHARILREINHVSESILAPFLASSLLQIDSNIIFLLILRKFFLDFNQQGRESSIWPRLSMGNDPRLHRYTSSQTLLCRSCFPSYLSPCGSRQISLRSTRKAQKQII